MIAQQSVQPDLPDTSTGPSFQPAFVRVVPALHRAVAVRRNCWHFFPLQFYSLLSSAPMSQYHLQSYHIPAVPDTKASASSCAVFLSSYPTFLSSIQPSLSSLPQISLPPVVHTEPVSRNRCNHPRSARVFRPGGMRRCGVLHDLRNSGSVIRKSLHMNSPKMLPITPVTTMTATVIVT